MRNSSVPDFPQPSGNGFYLLVSTFEVRVIHLPESKSGGSNSRVDPLVTILQLQSPEQDTIRIQRSSQVVCPFLQHIVNRIDD